MFRLLAKIALPTVLLGWTATTMAAAPPRFLRPMAGGGHQASGRRGAAGGPSGTGPSGRAGGGAGGARHGGCPSGSGAPASPAGFAGVRIPNNRPPFPTPVRSPAAIRAPLLRASLKFESKGVFFYALDYPLEACGDCQPGARLERDAWRGRGRAAAAGRAAAGPTTAQSPHGH